MNKNLIKVVSILLLIVLLAGAVALVLYATNGFTTDFTTFYATYKGERVVTSKKGVTFNGLEKIEVNYLFGFAQQEDTLDYSVKIIPYSEAKTFMFTVDGALKSFSAEKDFTAGFNLKKYKSYFTIDCTNVTLQVLLERIYEGKVVEVPEVSFDTEMFTLVISSYNDEQTVLMHFSLIKSGVVLTPDNLEF